MPSTPPGQQNIRADPRREQGCPRSSPHHNPSSGAVSPARKAACCSALSDAAQPANSPCSPSFKPLTWAWGGRGLTAWVLTCAQGASRALHNTQRSGATTIQESSFSRRSHPLQQGGSISCLPYQLNITQGPARRGVLPGSPQF